VRKFTSELRTGKGHLADRKGTGSGHLITLKLNNLHEVEDRKRTGKGQEEDRKRDTTIYPNPKPNPKPKKKEIKEYSLYGEFNNVRLTDEQYQKLSDKYNGKHDGMIETMSQHIDSKKKDPYTGKTHYSAILKNDHWLDKSNGNNKGFKTRSERNSEAKEAFLNSVNNEKDITPTLEAIE
jgi:hypothetical protein